VELVLKIGFLMNKLQGTELQIPTSSSYGHVKYLSEILLKLERHDFYEKEKTVIDAFGPTWLIVWIIKSDGPVFIRNKNIFQRIHENQIVFVPPFSIIEWLMPKGITHWKAFVPTYTLPISAPKTPRAYEGYGELDLKDNLKDLIIFLFSAKCSFEIVEQRFRSKLAIKIKTFIDANYKFDFRIQDLARELNISRVVLSRCFQNCYRISPLQYRQRIRIFDTMKQMNTGVKITEALFESGFSGVSEFNRQFKNTLGTTPKNYSPINKSPKNYQKGYKSSSVDL
jgi:AraC-like DNA-binding protein